MRSAPIYIIRRWRGGVTCVALKVTQRDIDRGLNASKPGVYLFRGMWYGRDPTNIKSFGKIEGRLNHEVGVRQVGRVSACMAPAALNRLK